MSKAKKKDQLHLVFMKLDPAMGDTVDDAEIERMVGKLSEALKEGAEIADVSYELAVVAVFEFAARFITAPILGRDWPESEKNIFINKMEKMLRVRVETMLQGIPPGDEAWPGI